MDYNQLYTLIPKEPRRWNQEDIAIWLEFIGLNMITNLFRINTKYTLSCLECNAIDGSCLEVLNEQDLIELGIDSALRRKKLLQCKLITKIFLKGIQVGLNEYKQYVRNKNGPNEWSLISNVAKIEQQIPRQIHQPIFDSRQSIIHFHSMISDDQQILDIRQPKFEQITESKEFNDLEYTPVKNLNMYATYPLNNPQPAQEKVKIQFKKQDEKEDKQFQDKFEAQGELVESQKVIEPPQLVQITNQNQQMEATKIPIYSIPSEQSKHNFHILQEDNNQRYLVTEKGVTIGRGQENDIILKEDYVSRAHCKIFFKDEKFYIQDLGSTAGTFIQLNLPSIMKQGLILHIGSYQYQIHYHAQEKQCEVTFTTLDGQYAKKQFSVTLLLDQPQLVFGRQLQIFNSDTLKLYQHMSGQHVKFTYIHAGVILEDQNSSNGTWLRMSEPQFQSEPVRLIDGRQFRLGFEKFLKCVF